MVAMSSLDELPTHLCVHRNCDLCKEPVTGEKVIVRR